MIHHGGYEALLQPKGNSNGTTPTRHAASPHHPRTMRVLPSSVSEPNDSIDVLDVFGSICHMVEGVVSYGELQCLSPSDGDPALEALLGGFRDARKLQLQIAHLRHALDKHEQVLAAKEVTIKTLNDEVSAHKDHYRREVGLPSASQLANDAWCSLFTTETKVSLVDNALRKSKELLDLGVQAESLTDRVIATELREAAMREETASLRVRDTAMAEQVKQANAMATRKEREADLADEELQRMRGQLQQVGELKEEVMKKERRLKQKDLELQQLTTSVTVVNQLRNDLYNSEQRESAMQRKYQTLEEELMELRMTHNMDQMALMKANATAEAAVAAAAEASAAAEAAAIAAAAAAAVSPPPPPPPAPASSAALQAALAKVQELELKLREKDTQLDELVMMASRRRDSDADSSDEELGSSSGDGSGAADTSGGAGAGEDGEDLGRKGKAGVKSSSVYESDDDSALQPIQEDEESEENEGGNDDRGAAKANGASGVHKQTASLLPEKEDEEEQNLKDQEEEEEAESESQATTVSKSAAQEEEEAREEQQVDEGVVDEVEEQIDVQTPVEEEEEEEGERYEQDYEQEEDDDDEEEEEGEKEGGEQETEQVEEPAGRDEEEEGDEENGDDDDDDDDDDFVSAHGSAHLKRDSRKLDEDDDQEEEEGQEDEEEEEEEDEEEEEGEEEGDLLAESTKAHVTANGGSDSDPLNDSLGGRNKLKPNLSLQVSWGAAGEGGDENEADGDDDDDDDDDDTETASPDNRTAAAGGGGGSSARFAALGLDTAISPMTIDESAFAADGSGGGGGGVRGRKEGGGAGDRPPRTGHHQRNLSTSPSPSPMIRGPTHLRAPSNMHFKSLSSPRSALQVPDHGLDAVDLSSSQEGEEGSVSSGNMLIIETGGWRLRCGLISREGKSFFDEYPSCVARPKKRDTDSFELVQMASGMLSSGMYATFRQDGVFVGGDAWYCCMDHPDAGLRAKLQLINVMHRGHVRLEQREELYQLWNHTFNYLKQEAMQVPVMVTFKPSCTAEEVQAMAVTMLDRFQVPALRMINEASLIALAADCGIGLIVDIGQDSTCVSPMFEGHLLADAVREEMVGGEDVTRYLDYMLLSRTNEGYNQMVDRRRLEYARKVKETHCYVAKDFMRERKKLGHFKRKSMKVMGMGLPGGSSEGGTPKGLENYEEVTPQSINEEEEEVDNPVEIDFERKNGELLQIRVGRERFHAPEVLFRPDLWDESEHALSLPALIADALMACDPELREELVSNIIVTGNGARIHGLAHRLQLELELCLPEYMVGSIRVNMLVGDDELRLENATSTSHASPSAVLKGAQMLYDRERDSYGCWIMCTDYQENPDMVRSQWFWGGD